MAVSTETLYRVRVPNVCELFYAPSRWRAGEYDLFYAMNLDKNDKPPQKPYMKKEWAELLHGLKWQKAESNSMLQQVVAEAKNKIENRADMKGEPFDFSAIEWFQVEKNPTFQTFAGDAVRLSHFVWVVRNTVITLFIVALMAFFAWYFFF